MTGIVWGGRNFEFSVSNGFPGGHVTEDSRRNAIYKIFHEFSAGAIVLSSGEAKRFNEED